MKLWTFGYIGQRVTALNAALAAMSPALLVDVRLWPYSRVREWARSELRHRFGARYLHLCEFGNRHYKTEGPVELADAPAGVRALVAATRPLLAVGEPNVVILCACRERARCHRNDVAELLLRQVGDAVDAGELVRVPRTPEQGTFW